MLFKTDESLLGVDTPLLGPSVFGEGCVHESTEQSNSNKDVTWLLD